MPSAETVRRWLEEDRAGFRASYARAREVQADLLAAECVEIADAAVGEDSAGVQAARLRFDARRWYAARMFPRRYGDLVRSEVSGPEGTPLSELSLVDIVRAAALEEAKAAAMHLEARNGRAP